MGGWVCGSDKNGHLNLFPFNQGLTGSRYPTQPDLFFNYPTRPVPKFENDRVAGNKYFILTAIRRSIWWEMQPTKWQIQLILSQEIIFLSFIEITERNGSFCASHSYSLWLSLAQKALARLATSQLRSSSLSHSGIDIPHICRQRHQQRWCKNFKVRGIFSIFNAKGTPAELIFHTMGIFHPVFNFTHNK